MSLGNILFSSLIGLQISSALFAIRYWPLTDYPMFSHPIREFHKISRLSIDDVYKDRIQTWPREDYHAVGLKDHRLQVYAEYPENPRVKEILAETISKRSPRREKPMALRINKLTVSLDDNGGLIQEKVMVREISYEELIP